LQLVLFPVDFVVSRFTRIPAAVYQLKRLEILMANDNQISEIDAVSLCQLPMLAVLTLQNNNISTVPPELGNCTQLRLVVDCVRFQTVLREEILPLALILNVGCYGGKQQIPIWLSV
jgi:hypothetical protein